MLSIEKCKEVLNKKGKKYTTEEAMSIRESLYQMAEIINNLKKVSDEKFKG